MFFLPPSLVQHHAQCCGCSYFFPPTISNQRLSFCCPVQMITTCHARLRLQVRDMFAQMASALAHSKVRRFPRLRLLLCFPIFPHCICKQQVPQTSLILRRAELTVIEASTSAGPIVLHYIVKGSLAILDCTSHHITDHDITHHHIITSSHHTASHCITLHHTTSRIPT